MSSALIRLVEAEGSTRAIALLRIALVFIIWARFGRELAFHTGRDPAFIVLAMWYFTFTGLMLIGLYTRIAVAIVACTLAFMYFGFGLGIAGLHWVAHHTYVLMAAVAFLALTPCGRSYSIDRYREVREAERRGVPPPPERGRLWGAKLIVLQMSALYFWTAYDKTDWAWISGQRLEQIMIWHYANRPLDDLMLNPMLLACAAVAVVLVEYFLAVAIHVRGLFWIAVPAGLALHAAFFLLLPLMTFSATMMALYIVVVDPDAVHRFLDRLHGYAPAAHRI